MLTVVGTVAFDTLANVKALASPEATGGIVDLQPDTPGGTAGNVARALARLGAPPAIVSAVGPDFERSAYARTLAESGIDASALQVGTLPTSRAYVFYEPRGGQMTYFYGGASTQFLARTEDVAGKRAHFCAGEISQYPAMMAAAEWVSFDPGQEIFHRDSADIEACLTLVDVLFANRHEMAIMDERGWSLRRLFDGGARIVVETRGPEGTLVHTPSGRFAAPAVALARVVDPTGAGDAHRAGFLYALEHGLELGMAARFANVLGSFAVEHVGAQAGHPTLAQAIERHEKAYGERPF